MLFHSSLRKELARSFGATLVVLVTIVMTMTLVRTLNLTSRGAFNPEDILMVMGYAVIGYMPLLLALSLFVAIVGTLSRMYRDSETVIWFGAGRGLSAFLAPLFRFAWPILLVITALALVVWPWANSQTDQLRDRYGRRGDLERVAPGQFQESASGTRVFFLDKDTPDNKSGKNIFIATNEHGRESVTAAKSGKIVEIGNSQFLLLGSGQRMEAPRTGPREIRLSEFEEYAAKVGGGDLSARDNVPAKTKSTLALIADPTPVNLGELGWRLGLALAAVNFIVIAVIVSHVNPRAGRSGNLVFALFAFVVYYNMVNIGQSWVSTGRATFAGFTLALHGGVLLGSLLWLAKQHNNWTFARIARRTGGDASA